MNPDWSLCAEGRQQSPIDLADATKMEMSGAVIDRPSHVDATTAIDNGHTIQVKAKTGETFTVGDKTFALLQYHFHAPSEHTVDGEHSPMEMHFVHQAEDGALAVVGLLIEEGMSNPGISPLWAQLPEGPGTETTVEIPAAFADHIFPGVGTGFYHYVGSLTTPPCSEGVQWYVRKTFTTLSKEQIAEFTAVYDHNNRPVQALNERALYLDENPTVTIN